MVCSRKPEGAVPTHTFIANKNILDGEHECMTHMKYPCYIWWRHDDRVGCRIGYSMAVSNHLFRSKISRLFPQLIRYLFLNTRIVGL